ncbi:MAG TPA: four helix bundle protein [Thermoanaerobaculia bacterium]|nr:four helix bundle protein [Thermoanaerobaculia bacterium]
MATVARFEDLEAWKQARILARRLYAITQRDSVRRDFAFVTQVRRAAFSAMSNIAEGFGRRSDRDFAHFLSIAHASVAEAQSLLYVALDIAYIDEMILADLYEEADHCSRLIQSLALYLAKNRRSG